MINALEYGLLSLTNPAQHEDDHNAGHLILKTKEVYYWAGAIDLLQNFDLTELNNVAENPASASERMELALSALRVGWAPIGYSKFGDFGALGFRDIPGMEAGEREAEDERSPISQVRCCEDYLFRGSVALRDFVGTYIYGYDYSSVPSSDEEARKLLAIYKLIAAIEYRVREADKNLEKLGLTNDPFFMEFAGATVLALGAIPYSFSKRTRNGDTEFKRIKALLWEYESSETEQKRSVKYHLSMDTLLKALLNLLVRHAQHVDDRSDYSQSREEVLGTFESIVEDLAKAGSASSEPGKDRTVSLPAGDLEAIFEAMASQETDQKGS